MRTLLVLLALAVSAPASAAWRRIDSPNFIVIGDASSGELRRIVARFEGFHEALRRVLPQVPTVSPVPTLVLVFPSDKSFTPFKPLYRGKPKSVAGYAGSGSDVNYIAMLNDGTEYTDRVILHEYTHIVVADTMARVPVWLNEGLADFYSTFALTDGGRRAEIGRPIENHLRVLDGSLKVPLAELLKVNPGSPLYNEGDRVGSFYAESWALTHMLISATPNGVSKLGTYLQRVNSGTGEAEAWEQVFGTATTETELRRYLVRPSYKALLITFTKTVATLPVTETTLSPADTAAFQARLQIRYTGLDSAAKTLAPALRTDPDGVQTNITMAQIELARRDAAAAEKRLMALPRTDDWFAAYIAGMTLTLAAVQERNMDTRHDALARATQLLAQVEHDHPELPNALAQLVALEMIANPRPSAEAMARIARARTLAPGRIDYALTQAELFANAGDYATARNVVGPLTTAGYPAYVRNAAQRLLAELADLENAASERVRAKALAAADADEGKPRDTSRQTRIIPDLRKVESGEKRTEGLLDRIDCPLGRPAVFHVRTPAEVVFEGQLGSVDFIAYRNDLTGGIKCGPREPMRVYVTWREGAAPRREKVVVAVEFLPKE